MFFPSPKKELSVAAGRASSTSPECHVILSDVTEWRKMRGRGISEVEGNKVNIVITAMFSPPPPSPPPTPRPPSDGRGLAYTGIWGDLHGITRDKGGEGECKVKGGAGEAGGQGSAVSRL